jgi:hypothetical protein
MSVFQNCSSLTSVEIPKSVTNIEMNAFQNCSSLASVSIPNTLKSIEQNVFGGCSGLTSITIPNSVKSIGWSAFKGCYGLTTIYIGSGVREIGWLAFASCPELEDVYCYAEQVPSTMNNAFKNSYIEYATLHVPVASIDDYKTAEVWGDFKTYIGLDGSLPEEEEPQKCATPTIAYMAGKLLLDCETEGVEYVSEIKSPSIQRGYDREVELLHEIIITVQAMKEGYDNSDVATATITWSSGMPIFKGFSSVITNNGQGDVNSDGTVDVADIANIISIMAGNKNED